MIVCDKGWCCVSKLWARPISRFSVCLQVQVLKIFSVHISEDLADVYSRSKAYLLNLQRPCQARSSAGTSSGGVPSLSRNSLPPRAMDHLVKAPGVSAPIPAASPFLGINPWLFLTSPLHLLVSSSSQQACILPFSLLIGVLLFSLSLPLHLWTRRRCTWSRHVSLAAADLSTSAARLRELHCMSHCSLFSKAVSAHFGREHRGWWICICGSFSQQFWGSLTKRDERALCGCLLDLTVTFLCCLLPLFIFDRLYSQVALAPPFERCIVKTQTRNPHFSYDVYRY